MRALRVVCASLSLVAACAADVPESAEEEPAPEAAGGAGGSSRPASPGSPGSPTTPAPARDGAAGAASPDAAGDALSTAPSRTDASGAPGAGSPDGGPSAGPTGNWASGDKPAVLIIEVDGKAIPKDPKIPGRLKILPEYAGPVDFASVSKATPAIAVSIGINGHGFGSYNNLPKKSFNIELRDGAGEDLALSILGLPKESDFVLYACYSDKTCLRNLLTYWLGWQMGMKWVPRTRWVELFIDGKALGLYVLTERIKADKSRVAIDRPAADATAGDVTGGYIIRREGWETRGIGWYSPVPNLPFKSNPYIHHYPKYAELTAAQKTYIRDFFTRFETVMKAPEAVDLAKGYRAFVDLPTWIDYAVIQELGNNTDGYFRSVYMTKRSDAAGGKLEMHPLWDYDLSYGNVSWRDGWRTNVWAWSMNRFGPCCDNVQTVPFYWERMLGDPPFQSALKCRWQALRKGPIDAAKLAARLDEWARPIRPAIDRNQAIWKNIGTKVWPNQYVGATYDDELKWLNDWIDARIKWIDANLPGACP